MVKKIIILLSLLCISKTSYSMSGSYPRQAVIAYFLEKEFNEQNEIPNIEEFFKQRVQSLYKTNPKMKPFMNLDSLLSCIIGN